MATTAVMSSATFLSLIRQNGVVDESRLDEFLRGQPEGLRSADDARPLAEAMIRARLVTQFQSNLLLSGKSKSLRVAGKYRLLDRLGAGGMGLVWLCEHIVMKRLVALKVLPANLAKEPGNLERFHREAQAAAALKHPNIVQAFDVDRDGAVHYLVMEHVDGINLDRLVTKHGSLNQVRAAHYISQAAEGLQHAAEHGVVHRDIKPSNLLLDRQGVVKILDMGLARFFDTPRGGITDRFDANSVIGTADYIAPEQARNSSDVDIRADIYSLGCTFYFLLTGRAPFSDANVVQKLLLHQLREPTPVKELQPEVDDGLVDIIAQMMAKEAEARFQTPSELVEALSPWTELPIDPPRADEMPSNSWSGSEKSGTSPGMSARTVITSPTSRKSKPAVTGATQLLVPVAPDQVKEKYSWRLLILKGSVVTVAFIGLILAFVRPWERTAPTDEKQPEAPIGPGYQLAAKVAAQPKQPPKVKVLDPGFVHLRLDPGQPLPEVRPQGMRVLGSDLVVMSGKALGRNSPTERPLLDLLHKHLVGGNGSPGDPDQAIIPYVLGIAGNSTFPNTLITINPAGSLQNLQLNDKGYLVRRDFATVRPEVNVLIRGNFTLPPGVTTVNALVSEPRDLLAGSGGSTLRVNSGAVLFAGEPTERNFTAGAGKHRLTIDFNGRVGFLTLSGTPDYYSQGNGRDFVVRARLMNTGSNPLVLSGLSGTSLRLATAENSAPSLVIQGLNLLVRDRPFRVSFDKDAQLGHEGGLVRIVDASLDYTGISAEEIDRPLMLQANHTATLGVMAEQASLKWLGKITGNKLAKFGPGELVLAGKENDFTGGIDILQGKLQLHGEGGTPAGKGGITVRRGTTLGGTGKVEGVVYIHAGATLQPGTEFGRSMQLANELKMDEDATIDFVLPSPGSRLLHYAGPKNVTINGVKLSFQFGDKYKARPTDKCYLITNSKGWYGTFRGMPHNSRITSADGKWTAKISYQGSVATGAVTGGKDLVLYDITAANSAN